MNSIRYQKPTVLRYGVTHFNLDLLRDLDLIAKQIATDLQDSNFSLNDLINNQLILDFRSEGHSDQNIALLIEYIKGCGIKNFCVVFNCWVDVASLDYPAIVIPTHLANSYDWYTNSKHQEIDTATDSKFLCMIRSPNSTRARFAGQLLKSNLDLRLSFGAMYDRASQLSEFKCFFPDDVQLPLVLDQLLFTHLRTPNYAPDHDINHDLLRRCAVNIIVESSSQHEPNVWTSNFVTEKSFKCFALGQMPIWWAVPGLAQQVRALGFDVFDDIVDHTYDSIESQADRMKAVLAEISRLQRLDLAALRRDNLARHQSNRNHLEKLINNNTELYYKKLKEIGYD